MVQAILFGLVASSALVIGGVVGSYWRAPDHITAVALAFASGALISALAFELFEDAFRLGGAVPSGLGLLAGAAAFVALDTLLERRKHSGKSSGAGVGLALLAAVTLDGIPENTALGVSLIEDASLALLVAIFFSNLPESLVGAVAMRDDGVSRRKVMGIWTACGLILAAAVVVGRVALEQAPPRTLAVLLSFAGGAVLASLADTLMPEAFKAAKGRPTIAFATAAGFFLSFMLAEA